MSGVDEEPPLEDPEGVAQHEAEQHQRPGSGGEPRDRRLDLMPGQDPGEQRQQPDADQDLEPDLHRLRPIRAFWSASSPTAQTISAPRKQSTTVSERLSFQMSYASFPRPTRARAAPMGMNTFSGLK